MSKGQRRTAPDVPAEAGLPDQLEKSANDLREHGFDDLADALEQTAERAREVAADA